MAKSRRYVLTAARRKALRKAQLASARKRRGHGRKRSSKSVRRARIGKAVAVTVAVGAVAGGGAVAYANRKHIRNKLYENPKVREYKIRQLRKKVKKKPNKTRRRRKPLTHREVYSAYARQRR